MTPYSDTSESNRTGDGADLPEPSPPKEKVAPFLTPLKMHLHNMQRLST
jgi:hypothetical protein